MSDIQEYPKFSVGEFVICTVGDRFELGRIKRVAGPNEYFVYYHTGDTAARTHAELLHKLTNKYAFKIVRLDPDDNERDEKVNDGKYIKTKDGHIMPRLMYYGDEEPRLDSEVVESDDFVADLVSVGDKVETVVDGKIVRIKISDRDYDGTLKGMIYDGNPDDPIDMDTLSKMRNKEIIDLSNHKEMRVIGHEKW